MGEAGDHDLTQGVTTQLTDPGVRAQVVAMVWVRLWRACGPLCLAKFLCSTYCSLEWGILHGWLAVCIRVWLLVAGHCLNN